VGGMHNNDKGIILKRRGDALKLGHHRFMLVPLSGKLLFNTHME
jgi:hypothetical protein